MHPLSFSILYSAYEYWRIFSKLWILTFNLFLFNKISTVVMITCTCTSFNSAYLHLLRNSTLQILQRLTFQEFAGLVFIKAHGVINVGKCQIAFCLKWKDTNSIKRMGDGLTTPYPHRPTPSSIRHCITFAFDHFYNRGNHSLICKWIYDLIVLCFLSDKSIAFQSDVFNVQEFEFDLTFWYWTQERFCSEYTMSAI